MKIRHKELQGLDLDYLTLTLADGRKVKGYAFCGRMNPEDVPPGYHKYDMREDDDCSGQICGLKDFVLVNHYDTFLTREEIDCREEIAVTDWDYDPWESPELWDTDK